MQQYQWHKDTLKKTYCEPVFIQDNFILRLKRNKLVHSDNIFEDVANLKIKYRDFMIVSQEKKSQHFAGFRIPHEHFFHAINVSLQQKRIAYDNILSIHSPVRIFVLSGASDSGISFIDWKQISVKLCWYYKFKEKKSTTNLYFYNFNEYVKYY